MHVLTPIVSLSLHILRHVGDHFLYIQYISTKMTRKHLQARTHAHMHAPHIPKHASTRTAFVFWMDEQSIRWQAETHWNNHLTLLLRRFFSGFALF